MCKKTYYLNKYVSLKQTFKIHIKSADAAGELIYISFLFLFLFFFEEGTIVRSSGAFCVMAVFIMYFILSPSFKIPLEDCLILLR